MRKECPNCQYGTNKQGKNGDKSMRRHSNNSGHGKARKAWKGYKASAKAKSK